MFRISPKLIADTHAEWLRLRSDGFDDRELADFLGCTEMEVIEALGTPYRFLDTLPMARLVQMDNEEEEQIIDLFLNSTLTLAEIGKRFKRAKETVNKIAARRGYAWRPSLRERQQAEKKAASNEQAA